MAIHDIDYTSNETSWDNELEINVAYAVVIPTVCILTIIGNLGTLYAFWKLPELLEKPSEMLILSLSCADLLNGLIVFPSFAPVWITPGYWPFGEIYCRFIVFCGATVIVAGLYTVSAISLDRFLLVFKGYPKYVKIQTDSRIYTVLAVIWLWSITWSAIDITLWDISKTIDESAYLIDYKKDCISPSRRVKSFAGILFLVGMALPVMLVGGLSAAFFYFLHKALTKSWSMRAESQIGNQLSSSVSSSVEQKSAQQVMSSEQRKQYIKPAVVLSVLVSAMAICTLPYGIYVVLVEVYCPQCLDPKTYSSLMFLVFGNAMLDPFLYAMTQRKILRFYKNSINKCFRK